MDVRVLGPVQVADGDHAITIDSTRERAVLATLAVHAERTVSAARLIEGIWGTDPPETAGNTLHSHISHLRKAIGPEALVTTSAGYRLELPASSIDASEFERLLTDGSAALDAGDPTTAAKAFTEALDLWRGEPFTDLADGEFRLAQERRFGELHLLVRERLASAQLALGGHERAIPDLEAFVAEHPYRERPWSLLMLALYRAGRQADALRTYQRLRMRLADDLGIDPSDSVRRLEERILRRDPQLDLAPPPPAHNLPAYASSFIGRDAEIDTLVEAVGRHRLVSIVGAGGIGKSRLATEAALRVVDGFHEGVWWVDLAPLRDDDDLATRVAVTVGAPMGTSPDADHALRRFLQHRETLIVLDNCEHLRTRAGRLCETLLAAGPGVRVLTTTRAAIDVPGEVRITADPLSTRASDHEPSDAARLFADRAESRGTTLSPDDDEAVRALVEYAGGIPLAIELAAARASVLTPTQMSEHLSGAVDLPGIAGKPDADRHHSLTRVLDLSYQLLDEPDRRAFDLLGIFRGAFDVGAAAAVIGVDDATAVLGRLLDASMIVAAPSSGARRFRLLEPMRRYAATHLTTEAAASASDRHCEHFRAIVSEMQSTRRPDNDAWRRYLWAEDDNLTAAVEWSLANGPPSRTLGFADAISTSRYRSGRMIECVQLLERMLEDADDAPADLRAMARFRMVWPAFLTGQAERAFRENALAAREGAASGDEYLRTWSLWNEAHMHTLGTADYERAKDLYDAAIALVEKDPTRYGSLGGLIYAGRAQSRALACVVFEDDLETLDLAERRLTALNDLSGIAHVWMARWLVQLRDGRYEDALHSAERNVEFGRRAADPVYEQIGLAGVGMAQLLLGDVAASYDTYFRAVRICRSTDNVMQLGVAFLGLAAIAMAAGAWEAAARLWGSGLHYGAPWPVFFEVCAGLLDECNAALGERFSELEAEGQRLHADAAIAIAATLPVGTEERIEPPSGEGLVSRVEM